MKRNTPLKALQMREMTAKKKKVLGDFYMKSYIYDCHLAFLAFFPAL